MPRAGRPFETPRPIWPPEEGHYAMPLTQKGWSVPCRILQDLNGWRAEVNGRWLMPHPDPAQAEGVAAIWHRADIISESDYRWLHAYIEWARQHQPDHPCLRPHRRMDPATLPILPVPLGC